jgi:hypothetical protein
MFLKLFKWRNESSALAHIQDSFRNIPPEKTILGSSFACISLHYSIIAALIVIRQIYYIATGCFIPDPISWSTSPHKIGGLLFKLSGLYIEGFFFV